MLQQVQTTKLLLKVILPAVFILSMLAITTAKAQTHGRLEIVKDPRIDTLIAHRYNASKTSGRSGNYLSTYGYRVQFFSGSSRKDAFNAQNKFQQYHPGIRTYITYHEPNFKVKAGDFRTRLEAVKLMQELKGMFISMFVISEKINPPKLENTIPQ